MTNEEVINLYIQAIRLNNGLTLDNFFWKNPLFEEYVKVNKNNNINDNLYNEIYSSDFYDLLINNSISTAGGMSVSFQLTPEAARALKKFPTLQEYCDYIEKERKNVNKNIHVGGDINIGSGSKVNLFSDNAQINSPDEALEKLDKMINLINQSQKIDALIKAQIIDMHNNLQQSIITAKNEKLPLVDNLSSIASSFISVFSTLLG